jgi:hypothetical protein
MPCGRVLGHGEYCVEGHECDLCERLAQMPWLLRCERVCIEAAANFVPPITPEEYVTAMLTGAVDGKPEPFRPCP